MAFAHERGRGEPRLALQHSSGIARVWVSAFATFWRLNRPLLLLLSTSFKTFISSISLSFSRLVSVDNLILLHYPVLYC